VNRTAIGLALLALVALFAAITVSVVDARRPIDGQIGQSFAAAAARLDSHLARVSPLGCRKSSYDFYLCGLAVRPRGSTAPFEVTYRLALTEDGCWTVPRFPNGLKGEPRALQIRLASPHGCIEGTGPSD
jgi:hypothetical protein